jgi:tetratricopeptide (TPR) repeat protein
MGDQPGLLLGLVNLGSLYDDLERPDQALPHLKKALLLAQATGEEVQLANVYLNIGFAYRLQGAWSQAETYLWQAEAIYGRFSNSIGTAQVKVNLGLLCLAEERWPEAKSYLEQALQAWDDLGNIYKKITTLTYLVEYELARGHPQQAARQLAEVENLITLAHQDRHAPHWESLLAKSRRSLKDYLAHQTSVRFGSGIAQPN